MIKKDYPLSMLRDLQKLSKEFKKLAFQNSDIIEEVKEVDYIIYLRDKEHPSFFFSVSNPNQTSDFRSYFNFTYLPQSDVTFTRASFNNDITQILDNFQRWVKFIREYNSITLNEKDFIINQYEKEIFDEFEIVDDNSYTHPFEHDRQIAIYNLLENIEFELRKQIKDENAQDVIADVQELKETLQKLTKQNVIKKLSKIFAQIKMNGLKLFKEVVTETRKEIIKRVVNGSFDEIGNLIN